MEYNCLLVVFYSDRFISKIIAFISKCKYWFSVGSIGKTDRKKIIGII